MTIVGWSAIVGRWKGAGSGGGIRRRSGGLEVATVAIYLPFAFNESDEWPFEVSAALAEITLSMRQLHKQLKDIVVCLELGDKKRMRSRRRSCRSSRSTSRIC